MMMVVVAMNDIRGICQDMLSSRIWWILVEYKEDFFKVWVLIWSKKKLVLLFE
jgi:hypothetical protein